MVSYLIIKYLSHFEFIFVYVWGSILSSWCTWVHSAFPIPLAEESLFSIVHSCLFCLKSIDHKCVGILLSYFFPVIYMSAFVPIPCCFDYCSFIALPEDWEGYASCFILLLQDCFSNSGSFMAPYKFHDNLFYLSGKCHSNLIAITLNLQFALSGMVNLTISILQMQEHGIFFISLHHIQFSLSILYFSSIQIFQFQGQVYS